MLTSFNVVEVWAPHAARVECVLFPSGERLTCERSGRGWFRSRDRRLRPGQRYAFSLDGGPCLPDPRSADQPEGVHGPSRLVDFDEFVWTECEARVEPWGRAVLYELHVGTFTKAGTFEAAIARLPELKDLGITHIELMPVGHFPGTRGWGYDGVCLFAPQTSYGGPLGLCRFVDACHVAGLGVVLDVVYNHLGPSGNYLAQFGPYFTDRYTTPWGDALNFDGAGSDEVRRFICDNAKFWLEKYHIDGLRLDAVQAIYDQSACHVLAQLSGEVRELSRRLGKSFFLIGECDLNAPRFVLTADRGGYALDATWNDDFHHALHAALTGERVGYYQDFGTLGALAEALRDGFVRPGEYRQYRQRSHGGRPNGMLASHFVVYSQNHDQVGNRPCGDRPGVQLSRCELKLASALTLLSPFTPMLFMGEEWGASDPFLFFVDHEQADLRAAILEGRNREFVEFGWSLAPVPDPNAEATFEASKLNWSDRESVHGQEMLRFYRELLALRRSHRDLQAQDLGEVRIDFDEDEKWLILWRGDIGVIANFAPHSVQLSLPEHRCVLGQDELEQLPGQRVRLAARSGAVIEILKHRLGGEERLEG